MRPAAHNIPRQRWLLLVTTICTLVFIHPITDLDIWWHLDSGQWMWEHHTLLDREIRSFTQLGAPWVNVHWSFQLLLAAFYNGLGEWGLFLLKVILVSVFFYCLAATNIRQTGTGLAFFTSILLLSHYLVGHLFLRPHLLSYIYLALLIAAFQRLCSPRLLLGLAGLLILWANSHLSAIVGATAVIIHLLFSPYQLTAYSYWQRMGLAALFALFPFCSPFTTDILTALSAHNGGPALYYIQEWAPNAIYPPLLWGLFWLALALQFRQFNPGEGFLLLFFAWQSAQHARFEGELALLLIRPTTAWLLLGYQGVKDRYPVQGGYWITGFTLLMSGSLLSHYQSPALWLRPGFNQFPVFSAKYPAATLSVLEQLAQNTTKPLKIFNTYGWGGFIAQRLKDRAQIFIDGRTPLIFTAEQLQEHELAKFNPLALLRLADYYQVDAILLQSTPQLLLAAQHPDWQLVAYDEASILYIKRTLVTPSVPQIDYNPQEWPLSATPERQQATQLLVQLHPNNPLALLHLAFLSPDPQRKWALLEQAYALSPDHELIKLLLAEHRLAEHQVEQALSLLKNIPLSSDRELWIAQLYLSAQRPARAQAYLYPPKAERRAALESQSTTLWQLRAFAACAQQQPNAAQQALDMAYLIAPLKPADAETLQTLQNLKSRIDRGCSG